MLRGVHDKRFVLARAGGDVRGVCCFGRQIVLVAEEEAAIDAFAGHLDDGREARMLVGPRADVERFWKRTRRRLPRAHLVRDSQPVYAVTRATLRGSREQADVQPASLDEVAEIAVHSARMIGGELGTTPSAHAPEFLERTRRIVALGWWWRLRVDGALAFMCNVGSVTPQTAQLQGVWSPPEMRGRGHAARAFGAICDRLLDTLPSLCLYVNDFNAPAIALYERAGFARVGEFQTILF